mgnify:CR=1 FL=1
MRVMRYYDADIKENVFVIQESDPITKIVQLQYTGATKGSGEKDLTLKISNLLGTVDVILFVDGNRIETKQVTSNGGGAVTTTFKYTFVDEFSHQLLFRVNGNEFCSGSQLLVNYEGTALPASIELSASETVLMPPEQSVLSALVKNEVGEPVKGVSVSFNIGITKQTSITDSQGIATTTYTADSSGDVLCTAEIGELTSNNITIEDCYWWDNANTDRTSDYILEGYPEYLTFNHTTDTYSLSWNRIQNQIYDRGIIKIPVTDLSEYIYEVEIQPVSKDSNKQYGLSIYRNYVKGQSNFTELELWEFRSYYGSAKLTNGTWSGISTQTGNLNNGDWYTFRTTVSTNGGTVKCEIINNTRGTTIFNNTTSYSVQPSDNLGFVLRTGNLSLKIRNIKVKEISGSSVFTLRSDDELEEELTEEE